MLFGLDLGGRLNPLENCDRTPKSAQWVQVYSGLKFEFTFTVGSSLLLFPAYCCFKFTVGPSLQGVQVYCEFRAEFRDVQDQNCSNLRLHVINCMFMSARRVESR